MLNAWKYDEQKTRLDDPLVADQYHFRQARTIFDQGDYERFAVHDYFIGKTPFDNYLLAAETERALKHLWDLRQRLIRNAKRIRNKRNGKEFVKTKQEEEIKISYLKCK